MMMNLMLIKHVTEMVPIYLLYLHFCVVQLSIICQNVFIVDIILCQAD